MISFLRHVVWRHYKQALILFVVYVLVVEQFAAYKAAWRRWSDQKLSKRTWPYSPFNSSTPLRRTFYDRYFADVHERIGDVDLDLDRMFAEHTNDSSSSSSSLNRLWFDEYLKAHPNRSAPPVNYDKWLAFAVLNRCPLHPNYYLQIGKDLAPFRRLVTPQNPTPISPQMIHKARNLQKKRFRTLIKFHRGRLFVNNRLKNTHKYMTSELAAIFPADKKITLVVNLRDNPAVMVADNHTNATAGDADTVFVRNRCLRQNYHRYKHNTGFFLNHERIELTPLVPVFSSCKSVCNADILLPYKSLEYEKPINDTTPWAAKLNQFFWRGATTGTGPGEYRRAITNYRMLPRMRLNDWARAARRNRSLPVNVNVGFTSVVIFKQGYARAMRDKYKFRGYIPYDDQSKSKYLLAMDGHTWPSRFRPFLFTKSLVFLSTIFVEWFSFLVRPWLMYVPVDIDLSDLSVNIVKASHNDDEARRVGERANRIANKHLTYQGMQCYFGLLVLEYAELVEPSDS